YTFSFYDYLHWEYGVMSSFAAWWLTLLGLAVICTVAEMLLPQGKTRGVIRSVMATLAVLVIVTPLPNLIKNGFDFDFTADTVKLDAEYIKYSDDKRGEYVARAAELYLKQNGYDGIDVSVQMDGYKVKSVTAKISDSSIMQNGEHINNSEIKKMLAEYFGIEKEAVMAYG
ncbi:MAG: stage III sporulation protein AF, partial [Clostridiales bacterium]|nr:stage III sporulation protein AF [Clostridiales bacterium]